MARTIQGGKLYWQKLACKGLGRGRRAQRNIWVQYVSPGQRPQVAEPSGLHKDVLQISYPALSFYQYLISIIQEQFPQEPYQRFLKPTVACLDLQAAVI